ncbi:MAG: hypothetical protein WHX93_14660 [bacterium]
MAAWICWGFMVFWILGAWGWWSFERAWAGPSLSWGCKHGVDLLRVKLGSSRDEIGISSPAEANPEGPMSFDLGKKQEIYILDHVNRRIQVFVHGSRIRGIPLPPEGVFSDMALLPEGQLALLDNSAKKALFILKEDGSLLSVLPLKGAGITSAEEVAGIYVQSQGKLAGIWANLGARSVRLAHLDGSADPERISVPGILSFHGDRLLRAEKIGDVTVVVQSSQKEKFSIWSQSTVHVEMFVEGVREVAQDRQSRIYLVLGLLDEKDRPLDLVMILDPQGKPLGRLELCRPQTSHEMHRRVRISPEGEIFQMGLEKKGLFIKRFDTRSILDKASR